MVSTHTGNEGGLASLAKQGEGYFFRGRGLHIIKDKAEKSFPTSLSIE